MLVPATVQLEVRRKTLPAICGKTSNLRKSWLVPAPVQLGARCKTSWLRKILLEIATVQLWLLGRLIFEQTKAKLRVGVAFPGKQNPKPEANQSSRDFDGPP